MNHVNDLVQLYMHKRNEMMVEFETFFKGQIFPYLNSGSYAKHTAINKKFDFDISVPFKKGSFSKLEDMHKAVYDYFDKEYRNKDKDLLTVKNQKVSIGLEFHKKIKDTMHVLSYDIVPGRELDDYPKDFYLNLYLYENWGNIKKANYIQTNVRKHVELIEGKTHERKAIRLMKVWKNASHTQMKSFFIELMVIKAFEKNEKKVPEELWDQLKMVLEFFAKNITTIKLQDPANSGNIVSDTLVDAQKQAIQTNIESILKNIDDYEDSIKSYFPENLDFPCKDLKELKYEIKDSLAPSILPTSDFA